MDADDEERGLERVGGEERRGEEREREREREREEGGKGRGLLAGICWLVARETSIVAAGGP